MAVENNLSLKNDKLRSEYQKQLIKTSGTLPQTTIQGEYGRLNSMYYDNRVNISQSLEFPTVYINHKKLLSEEWKKSELNVQLRTVELKRSVSQAYFNLINLQKKKQILLEIDSIYATYRYILLAMLLVWALYR